MRFRQCCLIVFLGLAVAPGADRPRIVGIANFAVKVDNLDDARKFYSNVVGMDEAFHTKDPDVPGDLVCFKVNDRQYVARRIWTISNSSRHQRREH
jgi:hypothetical protein